MNDLQNKVVRLYADIEQKTIAWKEIKEGSLDDLKNIRQLVLNPKTNSCTISIGKILEKMGITDSSLPMKNIPVTTYKDTLVDETFSVLDLKSHITKSHDII